ncbi:major facilitator superfamily domain-containing protein [Ditylenchus destructor]|uniref:Major facilitator superfamily domain-containing protein n=1 Tax=Ditylenchus destructor TaxID=166010 RepID=A0AAD4N0R9_9BILA|nr:major facilitator superfamily domain-containing protein [Ditylenchus destructor]
MECFGWCQGGSHEEDNLKEQQSSVYFGNSTRYLVLGLSMLCLSMTMSNSLTLNFTIICMNPEVKHITDDVNVTNIEIMDYENRNVEDVGLLQSGEDDRYNYNNAEKSALFSAIAVGTIMGTLPITHVTSRFGVRRTFFVYGLISAVSTLLSPFCAWLGFVPLFVMRVLQGVALSTSYPAMGSIIAQWSTLKNSGMYIAFLSCHLQLGPIFTMPVSGEFCESRWGWPGVYYLQGTLTLIFFLFFYLFFTDSPQFHRNVSEKELGKIQKGKNFVTGDREQKVPWSAMAKDISVWGIFATNLGATMGFQIFMQYGPIYLNKALKFDVQSTGFAAALPYVGSALLKFVVGPLSDYLPIGGKTRVILFATTSQFLMAACFVALTFLPPTFPTLIQICFTGVTVFSGLNCVGVAKSTQLMSGQFSHVLMAMSALTSSVVVLLIPPVVSLMVPNNTNEEWGRIFILIAIAVVITIIIFDFTAEVDPRPWTYTEIEASKKSTMIAEEEAVSKIFSLDIASLQTACENKSKVTDAA